MPRDLVKTAGGAWVVCWEPPREDGNSDAAFEAAHEEARIRFVLDSDNRMPEHYEHPASGW